jgi:hypothetical protein
MSHDLIGALGFATDYLASAIVGWAFTRHATIMMTLTILTA